MYYVRGYVAQADLELGTLLPQPPCVRRTWVHLHGMSDVRQNLLTKRRTIDVIRNALCFKKSVETQTQATDCSKQRAS